ncbi:MAG: hypothetical protein WDA21_04385 [Bacilli bacterium]
MGKNNTEKMILIDVGSSTIKIYVNENDKLSLIEEHSIYFKDGFSDELGLSIERKNELFDYFKSIKKKYNMNNNNTEIYATGIFRKLNEEKQKEITDEFNNLGLAFNIICHDKENYYLEKAMAGDYNNKKVLIINMGGKTTELVTIEKGQVTDRKNIDVGVAELLNKFPEVNKKYSKIDIKDIVEFTNSHIKDIDFDTDYDCAIFTGGELRFELLTGYNLVKNTLFEDPNHPYMVTYEDFIKGNNKIFYELTMNDLYNLMPQNPKWMDGARHGAILPQAIFEKFNIKIIIPSDMNLINGVVKNKEKVKNKRC